jgi:4-hydroxybenzoate polyprenyltransferase
MLGWSAIAGTVNWDVCLPLYIAGICWTLAYDTIYAHQVCSTLSLFPNKKILPIYTSRSTSYSQDKHDDARVGIRSTARLFGRHSRAIISLFSVAMVSLLVYAGMRNDQGAPYYMGITTAAGQLARIAWSVE